MCEAKVYYDDGEGGRRLMEDVVLVQPEGDAYLLVTLLGEQKLVHGQIERIDFLKHTLHIRQPQATAVGGQGVSGGQ